MGLINIPYEEQTLVLPHTVGAAGKAQKLPGLWDYVQILDTDAAGNDQEVSFDGVHWARLRKGVLVRVAGGTPDLQFRTPKGAAADVTIAVAYGYGAITDSRLVIDAGSGIVTVAVNGAPAAGGALPVSIQSAPVDTLEDTAYAQATGAGAGLATTVIVAAGTNVNGVRVKAGGFFNCAGTPGQAILYGAGAHQVLVAGLINSQATVIGHLLARDVILPAGIALKIDTQGTFDYGFQYKVL
jgi:hypothetical protein